MPCSVYSLIDLSWRHGNCAELSFRSLHALGTVPRCCADPARVRDCAELCSYNDRAILIAEEDTLILSKTSFSLRSTT